MSKKKFKTKSKSKSFSAEKLTNYLSKISLSLKEPLENIVDAIKEDHTI